MITVLNASYRSDGVGAKIAVILAEACRSCGEEVAEIWLAEKEIRFCRNCRACMQAAGPAAGCCPIKDDAAAVIQALERADRLFVVCPINFYDLTALFRALLERMACLGYWPAQANAPKYRRKVDKKRRVVLITTSAMPGILVPFATKVRSTFKRFARTLGFRVDGYLHLGKKAAKGDLTVSEGERARILKLTE